MDEDYNNVTNSENCAITHNSVDCVLKESINSEIQGSLASQIIESEKCESTNDKNVFMINCVNCTTISCEDVVLSGCEDIFLHGCTNGKLVDKKHIKIQWAKDFGSITHNNSDNDTVILSDDSGDNDVMPQDDYESANV